MKNAVEIARSGLQLEALRLSVSAGDVANALTPGFTPHGVAAQADAPGGVTASVVPGHDPRFEAAVDRSIAALSGTDLGHEMIAQTLAAASFRANLAALRTADETAGSLVDAMG